MVEQLAIRLTRSQMVGQVHRAVRCLCGLEADPSGAVQRLQMRLAFKLLELIRDNYRVQSEGGQGGLGTGPWAALSPVTLALRKKDAAAKVVARLAADIAKLPAHRRRLVARQYARALALYRTDTGQPKRDRKNALRIVKAMERRGALTKTRSKELRSQLEKPLKADRARRLALAAAYSLILRDTGRLFNSLTPGLRSSDQICQAEPGAIVVGSNVDYLKYHQSDQPRKLKKDGTPRLPRRQVLPDAAHPIPEAWWEALRHELEEGLASAAFWREFLAGAAA